MSEHYSLENEPYRPKSETLERWYKLEMHLPDPMVKNDYRTVIGCYLAQNSDQAIEKMKMELSSSEMPNLKDDILAIPGHEFKVVGVLSQEQREQELKRQEGYTDWVQ